MKTREKPTLTNFQNQTYQAQAQEILGFVGGGRTRSYRAIKALPNFNERTFAFLVSTGKLEPVRGGRYRLGHGGQC